MKGDTGQRARFLATLGFTQWQLREEYSEGTQSDTVASEGQHKHHGLTISVQGLSEALSDDIKLALHLLDLTESLVEEGAGGKLVVCQDGEVHLALTSDELGSPRGKRRLWSVLREVA
ncbi:hypothetical protein [Ferrimonas sp. YFM]|uniref:hypothetical protein n=1 Tax=Ferrimonas sp. YFM TaxID=3028878 RepID=UPI0025733761|nr:hypothetical protein [Ferrimonas sp. YFM]BDY03594.1 hypothetical protein F0521_06350 [Ferrimonas sp. YFM]